MAESESRTVQDNIRAIIAMQEHQDQERTWSDRVGDAIGTFAGTVAFVLLHLAVFAVWAFANSGMVPAVPRWDPYPFPLLCMIVSMEGVLLSTFVLIKQNRMGVRSDRRNHLDLQVNLLTEKEVTKVIQMLERISAHMGIEQQVTDAETRELGRVTAVDELARELERKLPEDA